MNYKNIRLNGKFSSLIYAIYGIIKALLINKLHTVSKKSVLIVPKTMLRRMVYDETFSTIVV